MTGDHAIKIESAFSYGWRNLKLDLNEINELQRELSQALEKQIPKKPLHKDIGFGDMGITCPMCGSLIYNCYGPSLNPSYCIMCGQRLNW